MNNLRALSRLLTLTATLGLTGGCFDDFCSEFPDANACRGVGGEGGDGGTSSTTGGGGAGSGGDASGGMGGEGGSPPMPGCLPVEGAEIEARCGVYVAEGGGGVGTRESPYADLVTALDNLGGATRIYVCGSPELSGSVTLPAGVSLYGGLDCATWIYSAANPRPKILGDAGVPALTIEGDVFLEASLLSLDIEAPTALQPGDSSIGVFIRANASVTVEEVSIVAGDGAAGAAPPNMLPQASAAPSGQKGRNGGFPPMEVGTPSNICSGASLKGGNGGAGGTEGAADPRGGAGDTGDGTLGGAGGMGQDLDAALPTCGHGTGGTSGVAGLKGSMNTLLGSVTTTGWQRADGNPGAVGTHGTSGGGGGGSEATNANGAGGGSGGTAGCRGTAGVGGQGGGSSLGLVTYNVEAVDLGDNVTIRVGAAGAGGAGQIGQPGQPGGAAGPGGDPNAAMTVDGGCNGGVGGRGSDGGNGAGGNGGSSIGIAFAGPEPTGGTIDLSAAGAVANGGPGGFGGMSLQGDTGKPGEQHERLAF
jgi:hypothetical protein